MNEEDDSLQTQHWSNRNGISAHQDRPLFCSFCWADSIQSVLYSMCSPPRLWQSCEPPSLTHAFKGPEASPRPGEVIARLAAALGGSGRAVEVCDARSQRHLLAEPCKPRVSSHRLVHEGNASVELCRERLRRKTARRHVGEQSES